MSADHARLNMHMRLETTPSTDFEMAVSCPAKEASSFPPRTARAVHMAIGVSRSASHLISP